MEAIRSGCRDAHALLAIYVPCGLAEAVPWPSGSGTW